MRPRDLLLTARDLLEATNNKPRQSNLRRATSTIYYALFHTLAKTCADIIVGSSASRRSKPAWNQVYRALEHGFAKNACDNSITKKFPQGIQDFANSFVSMQQKRHKADYDPYEKFFKSSVLSDIGIAETVIDAFERAPLKHRRAFVAYVLLKQPRA